MGTRSLTKVYTEGGEVIITLYRQMDGYPEGHGEDLKEFLEGYEIINGIGNQTGKIANGMECLAAQLVAYFKDRVGSFYLFPTNTKDVGEEFVYHVTQNGKKVLLTYTKGVRGRKHHVL